MKRVVEVLVVLGAVAALAVAAPAAQAVSPVVTLRGSASLTGFRHGWRPARFHVDVAFATDTPGAPLFTVQRAVIYFPDHSGTNGSLFPVCSARQITRFHGNLRRCPAGSEVGTGTVRASALQLGVTATGRVAMFNSDGGRSVAINIQTVLPAYIDETLEAPIAQLHGRYGEKLTLVVPHTLQEILAGVFVGVQDFDVTVTGAVRVHGVDRSYLKAPSCPKTALHGVFDFEDGASGQTASATADTKVRCTGP